MPRNLGDGDLDGALLDGVVHGAFNNPKCRPVTVLCRECQDRRRDNPGTGIVAAIIDRQPPGKLRSRVRIDLPLFVWWQPDPATASGRRELHRPIPSADETVRVHCPEHGHADLSGRELLDRQRRYRSTHNRQYLPVTMHQ